MAGRIPKAFIDELLARADIVEIIGTRVPLKKAGREYKACCPFHGEKTPSFWVSPEKQFYHCFGCGAHGTALGFLMEYDKLSFPEAIEDLAERLGLTVPHDAQVATVPRVEASAYELMQRVAEFYCEQLQRNPRARQYAERRGLTAQTLERAMVGYAPNAWSDVLKRFGTHAKDRQQLHDLGLIIERENQASHDTERFYDRFRDRLMFPIRDMRGRVIAFGGRIIDQGEPKYLNSPETTLFHKGHELYGLYEVRQFRAPLQQLVVVEGYMDAVRLHQHGILYAVAALGTATTAEHFKRIFRLVATVTFAFDGDRAGRAAAWRALQQALTAVREDREIRFLFLPEGQDPDSLIGSEDKTAFEQRLSQALPLSEYLVRELRAQIDLGHADGRARFAAAARPLVAKISAPMYRELLLQRLAQEIGLTSQRLAELWADPTAPKSNPTARQLKGGKRTATTTALSVGRGNLTTQAIKVILSSPTLVTELSANDVSALANISAPGIDFLNELIADVCQQPAHNTAQVLERFREHRFAGRLQQLASNESLIVDKTALQQQLASIVKRLIAEHSRQEQFAALIQEKT
jgi:DNA primase